MTQDYAKHPQLSAWLSTRHSATSEVERQGATNGRTQVREARLAMMRERLDEAIDASAWDAVKAIRERIVELDREGIANLAAERERRKANKS